MSSFSRKPLTAASYNSRLIMTCFFFACQLCMLGQAGFVTRLLDKKPDKEMSYTNLQEYYGRFDDSSYKGTDGGSQAFFVMLLSYEYATETIRFHFNMKEPGREGDSFAETDV